jgi:hypothetical protein
MKWFTAVAVLVSTVGLAACGGNIDDVDDVDVEPDIGEASDELNVGGIGKIYAEGAFTCDFSLLGDAFGPADIAPALERDRMIMSDFADGMFHKHLPIALDFAHTTNGQPDLFGGGRYLFKKASQARDYRKFVTEGFELDGVQFLERDYFYDAHCYDWKVAGARNFSELPSQVILRTERFQLSGQHAVEKVKDSWPEIRAAAEAAGMASIWVLYNKDLDLASVVYTHDRIVPYDPTTPDFASLGFMQSLPPLGATLEAEGFTRVFDRSHWVLTIWLPFEKGDQGEPSLWPHSPPFGLPFCGDQVCEVSRGESAGSCSADCVPSCGNGNCQPSKGENDLNCPGDCSEHHNTGGDCD